MAARILQLPEKLPVIRTRINDDFIRSCRAEYQAETQKDASVNDTPDHWRARTLATQCPISNGVLTHTLTLSISHAN